MARTLRLESAPSFELEVEQDTADTVLLRAVGYDRDLEDPPGDNIEYVGFAWLRSEDGDHGDYRELAQTFSDEHIDIGWHDETRWRAAILWASDGELRIKAISTAAPPP